jgi:plasmid stability protein
MKNITLGVDEEVLEKVRVLAAKRKTSINGLVRDFLTALVAKEHAVDEARARLLDLAREKAGDMGAQKWQREKLYDR